MRTLLCTESEYREGFKMSNKKLREQCFITLVMVIIMGAVLLSTYEGPQVSAGNEAGVLYGSMEGSGAKENQYEGIIRLHVVANSDSEADQKLKLKVRDEVISRVGDASGKDSIKESREWLESQLDDLEKAAESVIHENGCNYSAAAELGVRWIPEKSYGDMYFPAGNYEALTITLGKGEGENWWCVLFPPLCLITEDEAELAEMGIDSEDQIKVKSWLKEVLSDERNCQYKTSEYK